MRSPTPTTAAPGLGTVPRCSTSRPTRPGAPTGSGGTWWAPRPVLPRRHGVEYSVEHQAGPGGPAAGAPGGPGDPGDSGRLLILHNDGALNFELSAVPLPAGGAPADMASPASDPASAGPLADPGGLTP